MCFVVLFGFDERKHIDQSPHGRDGHAPFYCDAKSNFKVTLALLPLDGGGWFAGDVVADAVHAFDLVDDAG